MKLSRLILVASLALLSACSSSHRPVYSGHEESTVGVPGFDSKGKKKSPHVKLGQSYTVDGETYVPRNQPDYVEEGMASWYGPGFHGGKTANGERFDSSELTAAHRTLPLPSIVRVTMVSTGKQVYVRVNDRGPFAHSRILDMSRGAAEKIGLVRAGVAKVRVEYMPKESQKFADLLADGRDPKSIDMESEILNGNSDNVTPTNYASTTESAPKAATPKSHSPSFWDSAVPSANAAEPDTNALISHDDDSVETNESAPISEVASADLAAPVSIPSSSASKKGAVGSSPFSVMEVASNEPPVAKSSAPTAKAREATAQAPAAAPAKPAPADPASPPAEQAVYVQIGAFSNEANAERLRTKYQTIQGLTVTKKVNSSGVTLYHVRMGPYSDSQESNKAFQQLKDAGAEAKIVKD